ncbi:MAG: serine/threonine-protein kinase [Desulfobacteraceae bacterium]|jgi:serine/threonine protein kinase|nr:serine/threonine-protein kinase [Desulfobacteraceae bacterium]
MAMDENQALIQETLGDKYEIKHLIQAGGMGKIYLGIHKALDKKVAIKIVHQELVKNEQIKSRFYREAKLSASLDHSGIIDIYDFGSNNDFDYIIMPFIEGETLAERIKKLGPFDPEEGVRIMIEIADALYYAHSHNVIHRDIKPSNIMFDRQGKTIIADFGISKDMGDSDLTAPNTILGSPRYMSPEQIKGDTVDTRSDLYSLGLVFYEMMTGNHPFKGKDSTAIYYAQAHEIPPRPETQRPDIPRDMGAIIMKLLEKIPDSRYDDGGALLKDLRNYQSGKSDAIANDDDATIIDDATVIDDATIIDDATLVVGAMPGNLADSGAYPDETIVATPPPPSLPFYKQHIKALAASGTAFLLLFFAVIIFSSDSSDEPPASQQVTENKNPIPENSNNANVASIEKIIPDSKNAIPEEGKGAAMPDELISKPASLTEAIFSVGNGKTATNFSLWTDKDSYRIGEAVSFHFESKQPCYVVVLGYNTQGDLVQIFPNHYASGQFIQANRKYAIPDEQMDFDLQVFGPAGQETVIALVSDTPMNLFDTSFNADNPFMSFNEQEMSQTTRFYQRIDAIKDRDISQQRLVYSIVN